MPKMLEFCRRCIGDENGDELEKPLLHKGFA
jgi:hypothetical protein